MKSLVTLKEAAKYLKTSKNKIWRAVDSEELPATKGKVRGQDAWKVSLEDLETWAKEHMPEVAELRQKSLTQTPESPHVETEMTQSTSDQTPLNDFQTPTAEQILDRLEQAQRRAILLELQLQQTQRLLCENNEDQHAKEARAKQAELDAETARQEAAQFKIELETLKTDMALKEQAWASERRPFWKKLFQKSS